MNIHPPSAQIAGRYEVAGRPLLGGMGIVYLCFDHQEQRPVALKTFRPEYLPDRATRDRFLQEGETWVRLGKHPHIVRCYQVFQDSPRPEVYLALELIAKEEGRRDASLRAWLTPGRPLPVDQALLIALQIVRGMRHATETIPGFVHRDLKPENVLVGADRLSNAPINRVRVTDFGLVKGLRVARVAEAAGESALASQPGRVTVAGSVLGTPHYMAPEQWERTDVDVRADIYALGCLVGEMVTGRVLVQARTLDELRWAHQGGQALAPAQVAPAVLQELLGRCLAVEPAQRYTSWGAVEEALVAAYDTATGQPPPEPEPASALSRAERIEAGWSYSAMGYSYLEMGNAQAALGYFQRTHQAGQAEAEPRLVAAGLTGLGNAYDDQGDARQAIMKHEQALVIVREIGDRRGEGVALGNLGGAMRLLGDIRQAIRYYEQALVISRQLGDLEDEAADLSNLGRAYRQLGDVPRAISALEQALAIGRRIGSQRREGYDLGELANLHSEAGNFRQSIAYIGQALTIVREIGDLRGEVRALGVMGNIYLRMGDAQEAASSYEQALVGSRRVRDRQAEANNLCNLMSAYHMLKDVKRAVACYEQATVIYEEIGDLHGKAAACFNAVRLFVQQGDLQRAVVLAQEAAQLFAFTGNSAMGQRAQKLVAQLKDQ